MRIQPQSLIARSRAARTLDRLDQFSKPFLLRIFNLSESAKWRVGTADTERPFLYQTHAKAGSFTARSCSASRRSVYSSRVVSYLFSAHSRSFAADLGS